MKGELVFNKTNLKIKSMQEAANKSKIIFND